MGLSKNILLKSIADQTPSYKNIGFQLIVIDFYQIFKETLYEKR